ncbi:scavenger receptor cysteine-rich type 1 protein M130-like isoform X2 [Scyliorhinus canicula]|nr:scavenger receptor cysteine-rich type 1 protein M130-like isoform X2 [Scyliorhinus canicula]
MLRLVNGGNRCSGRLQIYRNRQWDNIRIVPWDLQVATVVCWELGCGNPLSLTKSINLDQGSGTIMRWDVACSGIELSLRECTSTYWRREYDSLSASSSVTCSGNNGLRLADGKNNCSGRVEVLHGLQWGALCDRYFGLEVASVVCEHLQCGTVKTIPSSAQFVKGSGPVWKDNYRCHGNESKLWDCTVSSSVQFNRSHENSAHVICSDESWSLRLTNGGSRCDGRVEIYHKGRWGRVHDAFWNLNDAKVICNQLDCGEAIAAYNSSMDGAVEGPVWINDLHCDGNESHIRSCNSFTFKPSLTDSSSVGVLCSDHKRLRLSDSDSPCAGRVEVYYNGSWGSVCGDSWDPADAAVVCKQLDCGDAVNVTLPGSCAMVSEPIWLDELNCSGHESFLWDCSSQSWGNHDCIHKSDVRVMCSEHKGIRLMNGEHRCEGRLEVFYNGKWGTVCSEKLGGHEGAVICNQLQCGPHVKFVFDSSSFGAGSGPIWVSGLECNSHESTVWQCQAKPWGQHNCDHGEDVGVVCSESAVTMEQRQCVSGSDLGLELRLVGGNTSCSGRVEILSNQHWGSVCDDSWDMADANVVCRQLACGSALLAPGGAEFGTGDGDIKLDEVRCTGSELFLSDCPSASAAATDCDHKEDAGVICADPGITSIPLAFCVSLGAILTCELIALTALIQRKRTKSGAVTDDKHSLAGTDQMFYEEIENIPQGRLSSQMLSTDCLSIDSHKRVEYYSSSCLVDTDHVSEDSEEYSSSIIGPIPVDYDDVEIGEVDPPVCHLFFESCPDYRSAQMSDGRDLSTLGKR